MPATGRIESLLDMTCHSVSGGIRLKSFEAFTIAIRLNDMGFFDHEHYHVLRRVPQVSAASTW
jgi:hypothetical protein